LLCAGSSHAREPRARYCFAEIEAKAQAWTSAKLDEAF